MSARRHHTMTDQIRRFWNRQAILLQQPKMRLSAGVGCGSRETPYSPIVLTSDYQKLIDEVMAKAKRLEKQSRKQ
jgi:hypothetical protein